MKCNMKIENGKIYVESDYNKEFVNAAHLLHGKWNKPYWVFDMIVKDELENALRKIYGYNDDTVDITIKILVDGVVPEIIKMDDGEITLCGMQLARRSNRDAAVRLPENVYLVSGSFAESGGSGMHPQVIRYGQEGNITVKYMGFPKSKYESIKDSDFISII